MFGALEEEQPRIPITRISTIFVWNNTWKSKVAKPILFTQMTKKKSLHQYAFIHFVGESELYYPLRIQRRREWECLYVCIYSYLLIYFYLFELFFILIIYARTHTLIYTYISVELVRERNMEPLQTWTRGFSSNVTWAGKSIKYRFMSILLTVLKILSKN